jgi:hypothetical protein
VYVASALALLVTTSFLNLRRYLRQRRIEMPLPIAGTWVGVGAVLIGIVMMLAMMIPRPAAEVAISQAPWHVGSPGGMSASRTAVNRDGGEKQDDQESSAAGEKTSNEGKASQPPNGQPSESKAPGENGKESTDNGQGKAAPSSANGKDGKSQEGAKASDSSSGSKDQSTKPSDKQSATNGATGKEGKATTGDKRNNKESDSGQARDGKQTAEGKAGESSKGAQGKGEQSTEKDKEGEGKSGRSQSPEAKNSDEKQSESNGSSSPTVSALKKPLEMVQSVTNTFRGFGWLKWLFYIVAGAILLVAIWKHRAQIMQAISDILRMLRELFGGRRAAEGEAEDEKAVAKARPRSFAEFRDPFATGQHSQISPEELVRYTFAAFEAWANDHGRPRSPDCTPLELVNAAVEPKTPLHTEARKLVRLYGEVAYASRKVSRAAADELREVWQLMRSAQTVEMSAAGR